MPEDMLNFVTALYRENFCSFSLKGAEFEGFPINAGIRQGCPLSPLLFAATVDVLLRKLNKALEQGAICAFADDISMVSSN